MLLCCASASLAVTRVWNPAGKNFRWVDEDNWGGTAPEVGDIAQISGNTLETAVIVDRWAAIYGSLEIAPEPDSAGYVELHPEGVMFAQGGAMNQYIGKRGRGQIIQKNGGYIGERNTVLGDEEGARGAYIMLGGTYEAGWSTLIGNAGKGELVVIDGIFNANGGGGEFVEIGNLETGRGHVEIRGGEFNVPHTGNLRVGNAGVGNFETHGSVNIARDLVIGCKDTESLSTLACWKHGKLTVGWDLRVGVFGKGFLDASGDASIRHAYLAEHPGSYGMMRICYETLVALNGEGRHVRVGMGGHGELWLLGGTLQGNGWGGTLTVREQESALGMIYGHGELNGFQHSFTNNGLVIAGGGELAFGKIDNEDFFISHNIKNTTTNGWYARNRGMLTLPPLRVKQSETPVEYVWGENADDPELCLVNSVRVTVSAMEEKGAMSVQLLAPDRTDLPELPQGIVAGLWRVSFDTPGRAGELDVEVRYDHIATEGATPVLHQYNPETKSWAKLQTTALPGFRVKAAKLSPGFIAAVK